MKNTTQNILHFIQSTVELLGLNTEIIVEDSGINMSYNFITDCVGVDMNRVQESMIEANIPVSLDAYIKTFTLHELGHAMDRKALMDSLPRTLEIFEMKNNHSLYEIYNNLDLLSMVIQEHQMNIAFEETAWDNAEQMNNKHQLVDWDIFKSLKAHSLSTYIDLYERDLALYEQLLEEHSPQIA